MVLGSKRVAIPDSVFFAVSMDVAASTLLSYEQTDLGDGGGTQCQAGRTNSVGRTSVGSIQATAASFQPTGGPSEHRSYAFQLLKDTL